MNETHYRDVPFSITILGANSVQQLDMNSPHYAQVAAHEKQLYTFLCDPESEEVHITRHVLS